VFVFCLSFAVSLEAVTLDRVVARVNSDVITLGALNERIPVVVDQMKAAGANVEESSEKNLKKDVLDLMIAEKLQAQKAKKLGMVVSEETIQKVLDDLYVDNNLTSEQFQSLLFNEGSSLEAYKEVIREQILVSRISKMQVNGSNVRDERVLRGYYRKNKKKYWVDEEVVV
ncbi:uncharacterized protein METZ01_LOCUS458501, partial [marine metagenome]